MQFLIVQTAFTGDVILATALYESLRKAFPLASIDFLVRNGNESLLKDHPGIRNVLVWQKQSNKYRSLFQLIRTIRKQHYNVVINCQRFFSAGLLTAFSGAKEKVGFSKNPLASFFDRRLPHEITDEPGSPHEIERNHQLIKHLVPGPPALPRLYPSDHAKAKVATSQPYVCVAPTSVWFTKQWPPEKWEALIRLIPEDHTVNLLGAPSDFEACESIRKTVKQTRVQNMAGKLNLLESAALMAAARMNYVNDSAPTHLASAMNAPVTSVFCSTVPEFGFTPLSDKSRVVEVDESLNCRPCGLHGYNQCPHGHFRCADIDPKVVLSDFGPS